MNNDKELTHIDLFLGIGGFTLAAEWAGFKTVVFCEEEKFCQKVLQARFGAVVADTKCGRFKKSCGQSYNSGTFQQGKKAQGKKSKIRGATSTVRIGIKNGIPIIPEIRDFDGTKYRGATLLTGGFPCQPFSVAGQRRGNEKKENIRGQNKSHVSSGQIKFTPDSSGRRRGSILRQEWGKEEIGDTGISGNASNSQGILPQGFNERQGQGESGRKSWEQNWLEVATKFCRMDDGVPDRVHRLKALGNAIVPQIAYEILKNIAWIEKQNNS